MTEISQVQKFKQYVAECIQIVYFIYFKPYTLRIWLQDIHPKFKPNTSFLALRGNLSSNPCLNLFLNQIWWLIGIFPLLLFSFNTVPYIALTGDVDGWLHTVTFVLSWLMGILLAQAAITGDYIKGLLRVLIAAMMVFFLIFTFAQESYVAFLEMVTFFVPLGLVIGVFGTVTLGVVTSMILGLLFCVAFNTGGMISSVAFVAAIGAWGVFFGMSRGVSEGMIIGVTLGSVLGVPGCVTFGISEGVILSIILGAPFILGVLRVYFWLIEFFFMLILFLIGRQGSEAQCLRYLPPRFDERIILPLPFMAGLITRAYWKNPDLACDTITYLINSTNQQKVATKAMAGIAADTFNQARTTSDIVATADQLAWLPTPPPKELGTFLPQFVEISQNVRAYLDATSAYRRYELLNAPIKRLQDLNKALAFSKNPQQATTFGSIAQHWLNILETAQSTLKEEAENSQEIPQVYIAGNALEPENAESRFKGRKDIFREIETISFSAQPPALLFYGGRRTGKTSSLKYLPRKVGSDIIPLLIDLQGAASAQTLLGLAEYLVKEIINAARQSRNLQLPYPDQEKLSQEPFLTLQNWFATIEATASHKRFLLCLDEFERLSEIVATTGSRVPLNFFRHILQHRPRWILLFSGSHTLEELDPYWSDYLINTRFIRLTYLQESEARELVEKPVPDFPNIYQTAAVEAIINQTRCQPYLVQLICSTIVDRLNQEQRKLATPEDVHNSIAKTIEAGNNYFRELWTNLPEQDQDLLLRLIDGETPKSGDRMSLRRLTYKEILEKKAETYDFQVPLVKNYIEEMVF